MKMNSHLCLDFGFLPVSYLVGEGFRRRASRPPGPHGIFNNLPCSPHGFGFVPAVYSIPSRILKNRCRIQPEPSNLLS